MVGIENEKVDEAIGVIRQNATPSEPGGKRVTLFVLPVEHYSQI
jgi:uncharacterized protein YaaQ